MKVKNGYSAHPKAVINKLRYQRRFARERMRREGIETVGHGKTRPAASPAAKPYHKRHHPEHHIHLKGIELTPPFGRKGFCEQARNFLDAHIAGSAMRKIWAKQNPRPGYLIIDDVEK